MLTTSDKKYIKNAIENDTKVIKSDISILKSDVSILKSDIGSLRDEVRSIRVDVKKDLDHTLGLYLDQMKHEHKLTRELIGTLPNRDEVRDIVREEIQGHVAMYHTI